MKTLVIHPEDYTTDFLSVIYEGKDWTVLRDSKSDIVSKKVLKESIKSHDRIIMMGHGTGKGLISYKRFIIDSTLVYLLKEKKCVFIWCKADEFVEKYKLKGVYTGMIISDFEEALIYCVHETGSQIDDSNKLFAKAIKESIDEPDTVSKIKSIYDGDTPVIEFNKIRIYENF